jgi:hypothetical protein
VTDFVTQCVILGELYENYKEEKDFKAFIEYNDLGLPLAYLTAQGLVVEVSDDGRRYVLDTFEMFIKSINLTEDDIIEGMTLDEVLEIAADLD